VFHRNPDPDSLGAGTVFAALLDHYKISYRYYCPTKLPDLAAFFGLDSRTVLRSISEQSLQCDLICVFDAGDEKMAGLEDLFVTRSPSVGDLVTKTAVPFIVNFDHHATNTHFGDLNVVDVSCASTTELIYRLFCALRFPITPKVAAYLLAGLLNDTDQFLNPATTASALAMAGELLGRGVSLQSLRALLFERRGIGILPLIGEVLGRLRKNARYGIAYTYITEEDIRRYGAGQEEFDGIANILNVVGDAQAMCIIKEEGGLLKGSFRTTREEINVGRLAELLGGGGHRKASGFRIRGSLQIEGDRVRIV